MKYVCVLENRSYSFHLSNGAILHLRPGANPVSGALAEHYEELEKDHYFKKYLGSKLVVVNSEKEIPWELMPPEIRLEHNQEVALQEEERWNKKIQERGRKEFARDLKKFNEAPAPPEDTGEG